jgi:hypothetical protein
MAAVIELNYSKANKLTQAYNNRRRRSNQLPTPISGQGLTRGMARESSMLKLTIETIFP